MMASTPWLDPQTDAYSNDEIVEPPSKSSRKRSMHALQDIGERLVQLSPERLRKVPMPEGLYDAVRDAQRFTKHEARRRQMQYIGKLMRGIDPAPIQAQLDAFAGTSAAETARQHRLERLRADFLEDEKVIAAIAEASPGADLQHLRVLRRNALKEREHNKPPKAYRELFRALRELDEARNPLVASDSDDDADANADEQY